MKKTHSSEKQNKWLDIIPFNANGVAQIVFPRRIRWNLRWRFNEWTVIPKFIITKYSQSNSETSALMQSDLSIIILWMFIIMELSVDNQ